MIRQTMRSLALAAAGLVLAGGAWGQVLRQSTSAEQLVAHEYFGAAGGREVLVSKLDLDADTEGVQRPYVALTVTGTSVASGNVADITFTLAGATFSSTVAPGNLDRRGADCAGTPGSNLKTSVVSGGAKSDSSVTFRVETVGELATDQAICFWVPDLQVTLATLNPGGTPEMVGVNVAASISQGTNVGTFFPNVVNGGNVDAAGMATPDNSTGTPGPITDRTILKAARVLDVALAEGGTAQVSIEERTKIASGGTPDPSAAPPAKPTNGLLVGNLSVELESNAGMIWRLDGGGRAATASGTEADSPLDTLHSSLGGQVMLSVAGPFQAGDKVVFGSGADARQVAPSGGTAGTAVELKLQTGMPIVYVPGGTDVLKPSVFAAGAKYAFNSLDNNSDLPIMASVGRIEYLEVKVEGYAYGVVRGGGTDSSYVRATCEAPSGMCSVFLDCTGQDGMSYFGGPAEVAAGATAVWSSDAIAEVLGGGWDMGRGRCEFHSDSALAVQHMIRAGHTLINSSAVVGRSLDEGTDDMIKALRMVADDICASVGMNDGTDTAVTVDTKCVAVDTVVEP